MTDQLLGLAELAELYGVTKATASNWSRRHTFPQPIQHLKMGPVWRHSDVVAWRTPGPQTVRLVCAWCDSPRFDDIDNWTDGTDASRKLTCGDCGQVSLAYLVCDTNQGSSNIGMSLKVTKKESA
jgi:predicted DNA-binding transcriptional regulator AlpA